MSDYVPRIDDLRQLSMAALQKLSDYYAVHDNYVGMVIVQDVIDQKQKPQLAFVAHTAKDIK